METQYIKKPNIISTSSLPADTYDFVALVAGEGFSSTINNSSNQFTTSDMTYSSSVKAVYLAENEILAGALKLGADAVIDVQISLQKDMMSAVGGESAAYRYPAYHVTLMGTAVKLR